MEQKIAAEYCASRYGEEPRVLRSVLSRRKRCLPGSGIADRQRI